MASSFSLNTQEAIDLNDVPSVMHAPSSMPEVWRPYFLSLNDPVTVIDSIMLNGVTTTAVTTGLLIPEDGRILAERIDPQTINDSTVFTIQCVVFVSNMGRCLYVRNHEVRALRF